MPSGARRLQVWWHNRCLNYRRFHAGRIIRNTRERLEGSFRALGQTFADRRTPSEVHALKRRAYSNDYVVWGVEALRQFDTATGLEFLRHAVDYLPEVLAGDPNELTGFLIHDAIYDETVDHPKVYRDNVAQLTPEFAAVNAQMEWGIPRRLANQSISFSDLGFAEEGRECLRQATRAGAAVDDQYVHDVSLPIAGL